MIAVDFQKVGGRSNFKFILFTSARLIAVALIIHQTCQLPSGAIAKFNRQKEVRQPELDRSVDKETRASDTYSSYHHPYGDSFEAIDGRLKSDLSVTPVDPMKTAASKLKSIFKSKSI